MPDTIIQQTMIDGSVTGGPVLPTPTHPLIKSAYSPLAPSDTYICNFETSRQFTLSGLSGVTMAAAIDGKTDHGMIASPKDSMTGVTASVTGSKSGYFMSIGMLLSNRGFTNSFTGTTIGASLIDDGMFVVTTANMREVATSVTSVKYKTKVLGTSINVFCKCQPDEMNFSTNFTSALTGSVSSDTTSAGEIQQAYNNLWTKSPLTGNSDRMRFTPSMTRAGAGPYITTVGLYDNNNDLMAVAKLARPLKKPTDLPLTFKVQIDI